MPLISVIVPIFNAESYLCRCLESLVSQTYQKIEIILVDDGSNDSSARICDQYAQKDSRVKVIHKTNEGVSQARNAGLELATGDYIHFTDADDWLEQSAYKTLIDKATMYPACDIFRFNALNSSNNIVNAVNYNGEYNGVGLEQIILNYIGSNKFGGMFILGVPWMYLFRTDLLNQGIRFNKNLSRCEDRLFTIKALLHAKSIVFLDDVLYHYETNRGSLSNKYDSTRWEQECLYLAELKAQYSSDRGADFIKHANKRLVNEYLLRALVSIDNIFFSDNQNGFIDRYQKTKSIIYDPLLKEAFVKFEKEKLGLKGRILLFLIRNKLPLFLSLINTIILYKNKLVK